MVPAPFTPPGYLRRPGISERKETVATCRRSPVRPSEWHKPTMRVGRCTALFAPLKRNLTPSPSAVIMSLESGGAKAHHASTKYCRTIAALPATTGVAIDVPALATVPQVFVPAALANADVIMNLHA